MAILVFCAGHSMTLLLQRGTDAVSRTIVSEKPLEAKGKGK